MGEPHTKGSHVLSAVKVLRGQRERALELLPPSLHKYLEQRILAASWYPLNEHLELLRVVAKLWPASAGDPWILMGRGTAQADLSGIYKMHLRPGDPARTMILMSAVWKTTHDTGDVTMSVEGERAVIITLRNFGLRSREFCRVTTGYVSEVLRLAGGRDVEVAHARCRDEGASDCVWRASWS
jgi:uncharacterized protein (TIGR02265 family)